MASINHARLSFLTVCALCGCACSGAAPEDAAGSPAADTHAANAQVEPECAASQEQLIDLGTLDPDPVLGRSIGIALNAHGTVVGYSSVPSPPWQSITHAFRWKAETGMVDLGAPSDGRSIAIGVNDRDEVVGTTFTSDGDIRAVVWDADNVLHELGTLGGPSSYAIDINNRGQVIGETYDEAGQSVQFIWDAKTGMKEIELPGPHFVTLGGINDSGVVVGSWLAPGETVAFKWTKEEGVTELDRLGGFHAGAADINNNGEIVGYVLGTSETIPVKWSACDVTRLPRLPNDVETKPQAINDHGTIVGDEWTGDSFTAVQWDPMLRVSALSLQTTSGRASDLSNCGDVTGVRTVGGASHAYLWRPERPAH